MRWSRYDEKCNVMKTCLLSKQIHPASGECMYIPPFRGRFENYTLNFTCSRMYKLQYQTFEHSESGCMQNSGVTRAKGFTHVSKIFNFTSITDFFSYFTTKNLGRIFIC